MRCGMRFEWDPSKDRANRAKHGVSFLDASVLLASEFDYLEIYDEAHSVDEDRFIAIGPAGAGLIVVVYTVQNDKVVRILSARRATWTERERFRDYGRGGYER
jgi:uncharacterized DUF497 family protein